MRKEQKSFYEKSQKYRYNRLTRGQIEIIGDRAVDKKIFIARGETQKEPSFIVEKIMRFFQFLSNIFCQRLKDLPLIKPHHKMIWDVFNFFIILIGFELIPLHISFPESLDLNEEYLWWATIFYIFDVIVYLNTSFYRNGKYVNNREDILLFYMNERFAIDFLSIGPLLYHLTKDKDLKSHNLFFNDIPLILFYLKFSQFKKLKDKIQEMFSTSLKFSYFYDLFQLIIIVITFSHVSACCFVYLAKYERSIGSTR